MKDGEIGGDVFGNLQEKLDEDEAKLEAIDPERSCMNCSQRNTCVVFQKASFLHPEKWEGPDDPPIRQDKLAVVCEEYDPIEEDE